MDIGEPGRSGRHRHEDEAALWRRLGGELEHPPPRVVVRPLPASPPDPSPPDPTPPDPFFDTDAVGLGKFNIGMVPASVTPPRTWKRAAWFAVLSSAGVLVGLAIAAVKLVGSHGPVERIGMPGYPTDVPLLTGFATTPPPPVTPEPGREPGPRAASEGLRAPTEDHRTAAGGSSSTDHATNPPGPSTSPPSSTSPHVTMVPVDAQPVVDAVAIAASTELFYEEVAHDSDAALTLVTDAFRPKGGAVLEARFGGVSLIEVTEISVDPVKGITVSTLQLTHDDGKTSTEKRELVFTTTDGVPLIDDERPVGGA
ncbi:hypothetical protein F4560_005877 [Saccharothrix ecbatanensis]|uniref:Uncharacterized protein n=1 Tax=Saccharothrix ecbatanensis TaxID=1105145 RepID=A0A7W9HQH8_9PSEU|nr:hypothetical protein [Saccharothrix ecbatanensis]MBB5806109.1 hypothetical protein [Saccharothrix ecbatanensis]